MSAPENLRFASTHEWFDPSNGHVGVSDHAQAELSDVVYVELPEVGRKVDAGEAVAVVESVKAASDIYAPVAGEITDVNTSLETDPSTVNSDPYGAGWLFKIESTPGDEQSRLSSAADYAASIGG